jgi:hypothetical protein
MKTRLSESSERVTERVYGAEPFLERQPAFERAHQHFRPGPNIASIGTRRVDVPPDAARSIEGDRFGRGVEARREERFDAMGQRIQPCRGGQERRKADGELRIAHRASRNEMRADEPELAAIVERDEGRAAYFRARSCCRGYRDDGRNGAGDSGDAPVDRGVGFERSRMACQQRHTFGEIDRRAASHRAEAIAPVSLVHRQCRARCRFGRVGGHVEKHRRARRTKPLDSPYEPRFRKPAIAHNQRMRTADGRQLIGQGRQCSGTELNCRQIGNRCHVSTRVVGETLRDGS